MPRYVIEREFPGAGKLSPQELKDMARKSRGVLNEMGPQIQWLQSYVTDDKVYCVYIAPDEKTIRTHAERGGFPADRISRVRTVLDPTFAEQDGYPGPERRRSTAPWTGVERRQMAMAA